MDQVGSASLTVLLLRRDGRPAAGAALRLSGPVSRRARAGPDGRATFDRLPAGVFEVATVEPGLVHASASVRLDQGTALSLDLLEPMGWTGTVTLLDEEGRPVPFAALEIEQECGAPYAVLEGDLQVDGLFTGPLGCATLRELSSGQAIVTARFGSRVARATIHPASPLAILRLGVVE